MNKKKLPNNINELFFGCIPRVKVILDFSKLEKSCTRKITWRNGKIIELECNKTPMSNNNDSLEDVSDMVFKTLRIRHGNLIERERELIKQEKMMEDSIKIYLDSKPVVSKGKEDSK